MSEKKKLPLLGKSLMPEVLPAPPARTGASPRERVLARLRQITSQTAALAAAATLSSSDGCGYAVVDPLPMPAGSGGRGPEAGASGRAADAGGVTAAGLGGSGGATGAAGAALGDAGAKGSAAGGGSGGLTPAAGSGGAGYGGVGGQAGAGAGGAGQGGAAGQAGAGSAGHAGGKPLGVAGYGVVDPMPNPAHCPDPSALEVRVPNAEWSAFKVLVTFEIPMPSPGYLKTASVQPPISVTITTVNQLSVETSASWPTSVSIDLGVECLSDMGFTVAHVTLKLDTSKPANMGAVPTQIIHP